MMIVSEKVLNSCNNLEYVYRVCDCGGDLSFEFHQILNKTVTRNRISFTKDEFLVLCQWVASRETGQKRINDKVVQKYQNGHVFLRNYGDVFCFAVRDRSIFCQTPIGYNDASDIEMPMEID